MVVVLRVVWFMCFCIGDWGCVVDDLLLLDFLLRLWLLLSWLFAG